MEKVLNKFLLIGVILFLVNSEFLLPQEEKGKLNLKIKAQKEVRIKENGKIVSKLIPVKKVKRGDIILYTISYTNTGKENLNNPSIIDPIPEGTVYMKGSAGGKNAEIFFSINGGQTYQKPPVTYTVWKKDGSTEKRIASPEMFTHVKWIINKKLKPGESGEVFFKVKIK